MFGYSRKALALATCLVGFAAFVEILQVFIPGRHARLGDFVVDASALCLGIAIASVVGTRTPNRGSKTAI
jgi:VanZ family protein